MLELNERNSKFVQKPSVNLSGIPYMDTSQQKNAFNGVCDPGEQYEANGNNVLTCVDLNMIDFVVKTGGDYKVELADYKVLNSWYSNANLNPGETMYSVKYDEGVSYGPEDDTFTVTIPGADGVRNITLSRGEFESLFNDSASSISVNNTATNSGTEPTYIVPEAVITNTANIESTPVVPVATQEILNIQVEKTNHDTNFGIVLIVVGLVAAKYTYSFFKRLDKMGKKVYPRRPRSNNESVNFGAADTIPTENDVFNMCRNERMIEDERRAVKSLTAQIGQLEDVLEGRVKPNLDGLSSSELQKLYNKIDGDRTARLISESVARGEHWGGIAIPKGGYDEKYKPPDYVRGDNQGNSPTNIILSDETIKSNQEKNHWRPDKAKGPFESPEEDNISLRDEDVLRAKRIEDEFRRGREKDENNG